MEPGSSLSEDDDNAVVDQGGGKRVAEQQPHQLGSAPDVEFLVDVG
jgi:hypothetical protein